jgi:uncharacterized membrane-anchored protein
MNIKGIARKDPRTKDLAKRINPGEIAIIKHKDIDEIAAISLAEAKIKAVLNLDKTISGKYPNQGPTILREAGIPIFESEDLEIMDIVEEGETIEIKSSDVFYGGEKIGTSIYLDDKKIDDLLHIGYENIEEELDKFIENTLDYAKREKGLVLGNIDIPKIKTKMLKRHVLVVVRGKDYKKDLLAMRNYIHEVRPILIGVDGGGDALMEFGYTPDMIVGDMDSVSDRCLKAAGEVVVHAYPDGRAPGLERVNDLNIESVVFSTPGTSEDITFLLAHYYGASLIVALGTHNSMIDFLEKGRSGMASTFLVRLKVGDKLVDAKGVNQLYGSSLKPKYLVFLAFTAFIPVIMMMLLYPPMAEIIKLLQIKIRLLFGY